MIKIIKICTLLLLALMPANLLYAAPPAEIKYCLEGNKISFSGINWGSGSFITDLLRGLLHRGYGCETEVITGGQPVLETALVAGDLDVYSETWGTTGRSDIFKQGIKQDKIKIIGNTLQGGTVEGWFVPDYVVHGDKARGIKAVAPDLKSVKDMLKYKNLFPDQEDPSKGSFVNCPTGWDCELTNNKLLAAYGLSGDYNNQRPGTGGALDSVIASAFERGEPIFFYYWSPTGLMGKYKFYYLETVPYDEKCFLTMQFEKDKPCLSAYPSSILTIAVSKSFAQKAPEAIEMFKKISIPMDIENQAIAQIDIEHKSSEVAVDNFLKNNADVWQNWVPKGVAARIKASLE